MVKRRSLFDCDSLSVKVYVRETFLPFSLNLRYRVFYTIHPKARILKMYDKIILNTAGNFKHSQSSTINIQFGNNKRILESSTDLKITMTTPEQIDKVVLALIDTSLF